MKLIHQTLVSTAFAMTLASADTPNTVRAMNQLGLDLHRDLATETGNLVLSPWSIQSALGMTYAGAAGETRGQIAAALHFPADEDALHAGIAAIAADLDALAAASRARVENPDREGGPNTALEIRTANRLFGEKEYPFIEEFLAFTRDVYGAPLEPMDFAKQPEISRSLINDWVAEHTNDRIKDLIAPGMIDEETRLVLVNAIYLLAPWAEEFAAMPEMPFFVNGSEEGKVPGLYKSGAFGHQQIPGGTLVSVPYAGNGLRFLLIVPDERDGLAELEKSLTTEILASAASMPTTKVELTFPQFKIEPPSIPLKDKLIAMGMPAAFDQPSGSADFSRMAPRKPDDYLYISEVVHRAFIAVDRYGTEAAAATAVIVMQATSSNPEPPVKLVVDRPFAFAIQHTSSGACLFMGRVVDPR